MGNSVNKHATKGKDATASSSRSTTTATRSAGSTPVTWTQEPRSGGDTRLVQSASVLLTNWSPVEIVHLKHWSPMKLNAGKQFKMSLVKPTLLFTLGIPHHMLKDALSTTMVIQAVHKPSTHQHTTSLITMVAQVLLVTALENLAMLHVFAATFETL